MGVADVDAAGQYHPALQLVHVDAPLALYLPAGHATGIAMVDPMPHMYPAAQGPTHCGDICVVWFPYRPALHRPEQAAVVRLGVLP